MQNHIQANKYYAIVQEGIWLSSEKTDVIQNNLIYLEKCCSNKLGMDLMIYKVCSRVEVKDGRRGSCQYQPFPCMSPSMYSICLIKMAYTHWVFSRF